MLVLRKLLISTLLIPVISADTMFPNPGFPPCDVCGAGKVISNPNGVVLFPDLNSLTCTALQTAGLIGYVDASGCKDLPSLVAETCSCVAVAPSVNYQLAANAFVAPEIPAPHIKNPFQADSNERPHNPGFDPCYVCGVGKKISNPEGEITFPDQSTLSCASLQIAGLIGYVDADECAGLPSFIASSCNCVEGTAAPFFTPSPVTSAPVPKKISVQSNTQGTDAHIAKERLADAHVSNKAQASVTSIPVSKAAVNVTPAKEDLTIKTSVTKGPGPEGTTTVPETKAVVPMAQEPVPHTDAGMQVTKATVPEEDAGVQVTKESVPKVEANAQLAKSTVPELKAVVPMTQPPVPLTKDPIPVTTSPAPVPMAPVAVGSVTFPPNPGFTTCEICGAGISISHPNGIVSVPTVGEISCSVLEQLGSIGYIDPFVCHVLPSQIHAACGCKDIPTPVTKTLVTETTETKPLLRSSMANEEPTGAPVTLPPNPGFTSCHICDAGMTISIPSGIVSIPTLGNISCIVLEQLGSLGYIDPYICQVVPSQITTICGCKDMSIELPVKKVAQVARQLRIRIR